MSDPFIGEIRQFPYNFAPRDWAFCDGQILSIGQFPTLFSIIYDYYGGNGSSSFGVPDLKGRAALHVGGNVEAGPGLSLHQLGGEAGFESSAMLAEHLPSHSHGVNVAHAAIDDETEDASSSTYLSSTRVQLPGGTVSNHRGYAAANASLVSMSNASIAHSGSTGYALHENRQPDRKSVV